jgi:hypothetical protein
MHSAWSRVNAVFTFFGTVIAVLCVLTTLTDFLHTSEPSVKLSLTEVKRLAPWRNRYDQAVLSVELDADLRSCMTWNTKQLFVYVQAEYETEEVGRQGLQRGQQPLPPPPQQQQQGEGRQQQRPGSCPIVCTRSEIDAAHCFQCAVEVAGFQLCASPNNPSPPKPPHSTA